MTAFAIGAIAASTARSIPIFNFIPVISIGLRRTPDAFYSGQNQWHNFQEKAPSML